MSIFLSPAATQRDYFHFEVHAAVALFDPLEDKLVHGERSGIKRESLNNRLSFVLRF